MATTPRKPRAPKAQAPAPAAVQAPAPVLLALPAPTTTANPLQALAALAPVLQTMQSTATPATVAVVPAGHSGIAWDLLTKSQQAIATAKGGVHIAPALQKAPALVLGTTAYRVRSGNNQFWWQCCMAAMQANGGQATAQQMVAAGACPKFVGYAVARSWLSALPA